MILPVYFSFSLYLYNRGVAVNGTSESIDMVGAEPGGSCTWVSMRRRLLKRTQHPSGFYLVKRALRGENVSQEY